MSRPTKVRTYSLENLRDKIKMETDPSKRKQLTMLLEEMAEVYPDESEIPQNPEELFILPKQWKSSDIKKKWVMMLKGHSFSGKTFTGLTASHLTEKHIRNDFKALPKPKLDYFISEVKKYIPFTPVWVLGTEASTYECLTSNDNEEYFKHADIRYVELTKRGSGTSLIDQIATYKNFLIAMYSLSNETRGTIFLDSNSSILAAQHEVVRRLIHKIPSLKKEQGIPTRYWFWRNVEQEGIMFFGRLTPINFIFTVKIITQSLESGEDIEKIRYHEETNRHLSSIIIRNEQIGNSDKFRSTIEKCRPNKRLQNKTYQNMTLPLFMYNLINTKKQKRDGH
jgi:hypothetical protein